MEEGVCVEVEDPDQRTHPKDPSPVWEGEEGEEDARGWKRTKEDKIWQRLDMERVGKGTVV